MTTDIEFIINYDFHGLRLDQAVAKYLEEYSRSRIQDWIKAGIIKVNQEVKSPKDKVISGDKIHISIPKTTKPIDNLAQKIDLNILAEDDEILIIDKPAGLIVHPGAGNPDNTLLNGLLYYKPSLAEVPRSGIVHRLDKDTSGLMVVAKTVEAQFHLVKQLQQRSVSREYLALVTGELISARTFNAPIGRHKGDRLKMAVTDNGKEAITHYSIEKKYQGLTLVNCKLETGRTHQIRVHFAYHRHPLIGDKLYNTRHRFIKGVDQTIQQKLNEFNRQVLHAKRLSFIHPKTNQTVSFQSETPKDIKELLNHIEPIKK